MLPCLLVASRTRTRVRSSRCSAPGSIRSWVASGRGKRALRADSRPPQPDLRDAHCPAWPCPGQTSTRRASIGTGWLASHPRNELHQDHQTTFLTRRQRHRATGPQGRLVPSGDVDQSRVRAGRRVSVPAADRRRGTGAGQPSSGNAEPGSRDARCVVRGHVPQVHAAGQRFCAGLLVGRGHGPQSHGAPRRRVLHEFPEHVPDRGHRECQVAGERRRHRLSARHGIRPREFDGLRALGRHSSHELAPDAGSRRETRGARERRHDGPVG